MIDTGTLTVSEENIANRSPWPALLVGLGCCTSILIAAGLWPETNRPEWWPGARALGVFIGLVAAGYGVSVQPRSALVVLGGAVTAFIGVQALDQSWDTARRVASVLAVIGLAASFLLLLPSVYRRVVISLLILFHFGAITAAVMSPVPDSTPWLISQLHVRVFRAYQEFFYLVNAYHFYAPEPGPPNLVWFCVEFDDHNHSKRWIKIPNRDADSKDPLSVEFYRKLSISENANTAGPLLPMVPADVLQKRLVAGETKNIPLHPFMAEVAQYRPTSPAVGRVLPSYVRFVAGIAKKDNPDHEVIGIKVYRIVHHMLTPLDCANERDPLDKILFQPFYLGEYDAEGKLKDPDDPFIHWHIPIYRAAVDPKEKEPFGPGKIRSLLPEQPREPSTVLIDYLKVHAGSDPWGDKEP